MQLIGLSSLPFIASNLRLCFVNCILKLCSPPLQICRTSFYLLILHIFQMKTTRTSQEDVFLLLTCCLVLAGADLGRSRLKELLLSFIEPVPCLSSLIAVSIEYR